MHLVKDYKEESNFWEVNPQLTLLGPFKNIWKSDRTKNKRKSSDLAWAVFLFSETSDRSLFFRMPEDDRKKALEEEFEVDLSSKKAKECIEFYINNCLSDIERQLKDYEEFLRKRTNYMISQDYTLENAQELDRMASQSKKIWDDYFKIKKEFEDEKKKNTVEGGRSLSAIEEGII